MSNKNALKTLFGIVSNAKDLNFDPNFLTYSQKATKLVL